jgi:hypothetical protein
VVEKCIQSIIKVYMALIQIIVLARQNRPGPGFST